MQKVIYDIEIVKAIPTNETIPQIEYCKGWNDFAGMGISVIGYQIDDQEPAHCLSAIEFQKVLQGLSDVKIIGFNSIEFDDKPMEAQGCKLETNYDLLVEVRKAAGFNNYKEVPKEYSYKLNALAKANGTAKTGTGELAPIMWQQGRCQEVIDYCLMDVSITKKLLNLGLAGELIDPNTGDKLQLKQI